MANPNRVRIAPAKLIKSQRLTNRPGDSHLNQRLNFFLVLLGTEAKFPRSNLILWLACFKGLLDIREPGNRQPQK